MPCQTVRMRVLLKLTLDCSPDAAWRALHSPSALAELYAPLLRLEPLEISPRTQLEPGTDVPVQLSLAGVVPLGRQLIHASERTVGDARILRDSGIPLTGPLAALDIWDHQMAVSASTGGQTLWRERLVIGGAAAPALWPGLWATWQWRGARLRALAPSWAFEPGDDSGDGASDGSQDGSRSSAVA